MSGFDDISTSTRLFSSQQTAVRIGAPVSNQSTARPARLDTEHTSKRPGTLRASGFLPHQAIQPHHPRRPAQKATRQRNPNRRAVKTKDTGKEVAMSAFEEVRKSGVPGCPTVPTTPRDRTVSGASNSSNSSSRSTPFLSPKAKRTKPTGTAATTPKPARRNQAQTATATPVRLPLKLTFIEPYVDMESLNAKPVKTQQSGPKSVTTPVKSNGGAVSGMDGDTQPRQRPPRTPAPRKSRAKPKVALETPPATPATASFPATGGQFGYSTDTPMAPPPLPISQTRTPAASPANANPKSQKMALPRKALTYTSAPTGTAAARAHDEQILGSITLDHSALLASGIRVPTTISNETIKISKLKAGESGISSSKTETSGRVKETVSSAASKIEGVATSGGTIRRSRAKKPINPDSSKWTPVSMSHFNSAGPNIATGHVNVNDREEPQNRLDSRGNERSTVAQTIFSQNYQRLMMDPLSEPFQQRNRELLMSLMDAGSTLPLLPPSEQRNTWELDEIYRIMTCNNREVQWDMTSSYEEVPITETIPQSRDPQGEAYMTQIPIETMTWDEMEAEFDVGNWEYSPDFTNKPVARTTDTKADSVAEQTIGLATAKQLNSAINESITSYDYTQSNGVRSVTAPKRGSHEITTAPTKAVSSPLTQNQVDEIYEKFGADSCMIFWIGDQAYHCDPFWGQALNLDNAIHSDQADQADEAMAKRTRVERQANAGLGISRTHQFEMETDDQALSKLPSDSNLDVEDHWYAEFCAAEEFCGYERSRSSESQAPWAVWELPHEIPQSITPVMEGANERKGKEKKSAPLPMASRRSKPTRMAIYEDATRTGGNLNFTHPDVLMEIQNDAGFLQVVNSAGRIPSNRQRRETKASDADDGLCAKDAHEMFADDKWMDEWICWSPKEEGRQLPL
ncbi:hypothetical protein DFH27DRAFT_655178 [Peziza echinospora]|nr:hypothetical protein DFH27DRAFT_655178 [Peziza echinospora]